jgi:YbbR domain-containing protein
MKGFIEKYFLENWNLKATAFLLALILWLFVRGEPGQETILPIPLEVQVPSHLEMTGERPATIEITIQGATTSNMGFGQSRPTCLVDLRDATEGRHVVTLTPNNIRIPKGSGIIVSKVNPTQLTVLLERTLTKEVPVIAPIRGELSQGFEIYNMFIKPGIIEISGPRSYIEPVRAIATEVISINGQKQSSRFFMNLNLKDKAIRTSAANPIQIDLTIGPRRKLYTITRVPVVIDSEAYTTTPKHISIHILAPPDSTEKPTAEDFSVLVETKILDISKLPVRAKPVVRLKDALNGTLTIKDLLPPEVVVNRRK